jgi:hypothetical protein
MKLSHLYFYQEHRIVNPYTPRIRIANPNGRVCMIHMIPVIKTNHRNHGKALSLCCKSIKNQLYDSKREKYQEISRVQDTVQLFS